MKKNFFYANLQEQFSLLNRAVLSEDGSEIVALQKNCYDRHKTLCLHLLRDFITPVDRKDLYGISSAILTVFSALTSVFRLSSEERKMLDRCVKLLAADPFRFDEEVLRRREAMQVQFSALTHPSAAVQTCFSALDAVAEQLLLTAVGNA
mgnify:CR=1 FL=1